MTGASADDDGLEIELGSAGAAAAPQESAEPEGLAFGEPSGSPQVIIDEPVRHWIEEYAHGDTTRERGGMLLGRLTGSEAEPRVTIEAAVEAVGAEERRASITFTHETWAHINAVKEERYPDLRIVGWFHTHPGYGVFLSGYDLFIHRNFFNLPWQIAYVVDPVGGDAGFFGWHGEDISRLPGYYAGGVEAARAAETPEPVVTLTPAPAPVAPVKRRRPALLWIPAAAAMATVVLAVVFAPHRRPVTPPRVTSPTRSGPPVKVTPKPAPRPATQPPAPPAEPPRVYVEMRQGDTLWELSRRHLGDPRRFGVLQKMNAIPDPKRIPTGTVIAVPEGTGPGANVDIHPSQEKGEDGHGQGERDGDRRHGEQGAAGNAPR